MQTKSVVLKYKLVLICLVLACSLNAYSSSFDSLRLENVNGQLLVVHKVEKGETLYALAKRYHTDTKSIITTNTIVNNSISLGQLLKIPIPKMGESSLQNDSIVYDSLEVENIALDSSQIAKERSKESIHLVKAKETLYSISKIYDISVAELKESNNLVSNELSLGQTLLISKKMPSNNLPEVDDDVLKGYKEYFVQSGDMLETIAQKFKIRPDSIMLWNELSNSYLAIGQRLLIKGEIDSLSQTIKPKVEKTGYSNKKKIVDSSGFTKILEDGIAKKIENVIDTEKYLALHRSLKAGTMIEVRNLMNNRKIYVRVVGKLPATGLNKNTLIRVTPICFDKLGIIDPKSRVEISYYED